MHNESNKAHPGVVGWAAAAVSLFMIGYLMIGSLEIGEYLRKEIRAQRVKLALDGGNTHLAREHLMYALHAKGVADVIGFGDHSQSELGNFIYRLFEALELSEAHDFRSMLNAAEVIYAGIEQVPEMEPYRVEYERLIRDSKPTIESLVYLNDAKIAKNVELEKLVTERRKLLQGYSMIASEFGDFFTLAPESSDEDTDLNLYNAGVLKGLPRLRGLPDGIDSLSELADQLDRARGKVQVEEGANAHRVFKAKMDYFRNSISPLEKQSRGLLTRIKALGDFLDANESELKGERAQVNASLRKIFFDALKITRKPGDLLLAMAADQIQSNFF